METKATKNIQEAPVIPAVKSNQEFEKYFEELEQPDDKVRIFAAQDFYQTVLYYDIDISKGCYIIDSKQNINKVNGESTRISLKSIPYYSRLSPLTVNSYRNGPSQRYPYDIKQSALALNLFNSIKSLLTKYVFFRNSFHPTVLSLWLMATYVFSIFRYFPYLHIKAEKGSGKTTLMELMSEIAFNGELTINSTEAVLFRKVQNNRCSIFLDEVDSFAKADSGYHSALNHLLNAGFNSSGKVERVKKGGKDGEVISYSVYSPKCFSGIEELNNVLKDRTIPIYLIRKKESECVSRLKSSTGLNQMFNKLRQDCYLFGLRYADTVYKYYHDSDFLCSTIPKGLANRELDLFEPLFIISEIIFQETLYRGLESDVNKILRAFAIESSRERKEDDVETNITSKVVELLAKILEHMYVRPVKTSKRGSYYDRDLLYNCFIRYHKDDFLNINTMVKFVRLISRAINLKPADYLHESNKKQYLIEHGMIKDLKERFL